MLKRIKKLFVVCAALTMSLQFGTNTLANEPTLVLDPIYSASDIVRTYETVTPHVLVGRTLIILNAVEMSAGLRTTNSSFSRAFLPSNNTVGLIFTSNIPARAGLAWFNGSTNTFTSIGDVNVPSGQGSASFRINNSTNAQNIFGFIRIESTIRNSRFEFIG